MEKLFNGTLKRTYLENLIYKIKDDVFNYFLKNKISDFSLQEYIQMIDNACEYYYVHIHIDHLKLDSFRHALTTVERAHKTNMKWHHDRKYTCPFSGNIHLLSHPVATISKDIFSDCVFDDTKIYINIETEITQSPETIKKIVLSKLQHFTVLAPANINYINQFVSEQATRLKNDNTYNEMKNMIALELEIANEAHICIKEPTIKIIG